MADILLIHGAGHGAWCWREVIPALVMLGHTARAIDLPSHGDDQTPPEGVTLDDYVGAILRALGPRTVLVGHSLGGLSGTVAADRAADRVAALVYLCAWVPVPGKALTDYRAEGATTALRNAAHYDADHDVQVFKPAEAAETFYHDCRPQDRDYALARLSPQSMKPHKARVTLSGPTPQRYYIRCIRDRAIDPIYQRSVSTDWPDTNVFDLDTGHSPFFAAPDRLAAILDTIAKAAT